MAKTRLCVAGFTVSPYTGRARTIAAQIAKLYPEEYETWFYFGSSTNYYDFLKLTFDPIPFPHTSRARDVPICVDRAWRDE